MIAALLSLEMTPLAYLSNGEVAPSTPSILAIRLVVASMSRRIALLRTLVPAGGITMSCAVVPLTWGNVRVSESRAVWDSVPGRLNLSSNLPPMPPPAPQDDQQPDPGDQDPAPAAVRRPTQAVQERRHRHSPLVQPRIGCSPIRYCIGYKFVFKTVLFQIAMRAPPLRNNRAVRARDRSRARDGPVDDRTLPVTARRALTRDKLMGAATSFSPNAASSGPASRRSARPPVSPAARSTPTSPTRTTWSSR